MQLQFGAPEAPAQQQQRPTSSPAAAPAKPSGRMSGVVVIVNHEDDKFLHGTIQTSDGSVRLHHTACADGFSPKVGMLVEFDISTVSAKTESGKARSAVNVTVLAEKSSAEENAEAYRSLIEKQCPAVTRIHMADIRAEAVKFLAKNPEANGEQVGTHLMTTLGVPQAYEGDIVYVKKA